MAKRIAIPVGIHLEEIFISQGIRLKKTRNRLKEKIYYVLSRIVTHEGNIHLYEKTNGYRPISSKKMIKAVGKDDYYTILKLLKDYGIIEVNKSYQVGKKTKAYRLNSKYRTGLVEYRTLSEEFSLKLRELKAENPNKPNYDFLISQFKKNTLRFNESFDDFLGEFGTKLLENSKNEFQKQLIFNKIGRFINLKEKLNSNKFSISVSGSNYRFNSVLTGMPKQLRNFLQYKEEQLIEIDLGSSQAYLQACILKNIDINLKKGNNYLYNNNINILLDLNSSLYPFMFRTFSSFTEELKDNVEEYYTAPYHLDFYQWASSKSGNSINRQQFKDNFMYFLFEDKLGHRKSNPVIKELNGLFFGIDLIIQSIHREFGKSNYAKCLQAFESKLLLDTVLRDFNQKNEAVPIFTVHDSVLTLDSNISPLKAHLEAEFTKITSIQPLFKIKRPDSLKNVLEDYSNTTWNIFKKVRTAGDFEKMRPTIFPSSIESGKKFLLNKSKL
jgi:hypothetical protein